VISRGGGSAREARRDRPDRRRRGKAGPVLELRRVAGDRDCRIGEATKAVVVEAVARRHPDASPDGHPQVHALVRLGDVLVDLAVGEPRQARLIGRYDGFDLVGSGGLRQRHGPDTRSERVDARAHHLPTPTWTSRNRAPEQAWA